MAENTKNEIIELTKKLITFKSTKGNPKELEKCVDFCADYLGKFAVAKKFKFKGKPSIVATYKNIKPEIFLVGHLDVVEAPDEQFKPEIQGTDLIGRGAIDMKGGDAIAMVLFKHLAKLKLPIGIMLTSDEEIGGFEGVGQLIKKYKCKFAIAPEPNQTTDSSQLHITIKEKGVFWLKIKTKGKAAHASRPWLGENAVDKLIKVYETLRESFQEVVPDIWAPTINIGMISGGEAPNKIPDKAEAVIDIRWTEGFDKEKILNKIKKLGADYEVIEYSNMLDNDKNNKYIKLLQKCAENQTGKKCLLLNEHGASDARFFAEKGMPAVIFGPYGDGYHGPGEYLDLTSIENTYNTLKEFMLKCSKL